MTVTQYVAEKLNNSTAVTDFVSDRIYHGEIPEEEDTYPVINYIKVSSPNLETVWRRPRIQISCRALQAEQCENLANAVRKGMDDKIETVGTFDMQYSYYENNEMILEGDGVYHIPVDIFFAYKST